MGQDDPAVPWLDVRRRRLLGRGLLGLAVAAGVASAVWRPLAPAAPVTARLTATVLLGMALAAAGLLASLRGAQRAAAWAFYLLLGVAFEALGSALAGVGGPGWAPSAALVAALAAAEEPRVGLVLAGASALLGWSAAGPVPTALAAAGYLALAGVVSGVVRRDRRRSDALRLELDRLRHGLDALDADAEASDPVAVSLRHVADDERRARRLDRASEVNLTLGPLVKLARQSAHSHAALYFDIDHARESAYLRAWDGPDAIVSDCRIPLGNDPFAFVLERRQPFYATDYARLLWNLPYYRSRVKVGTLVAVPVWTADVIGAVLVADRLETQAFTSGEPDRLAVVADVAARVVQTARAALSREEMATEFRAVYAASKRLSDLVELSTLRRQLLATVSAMVPSLESAAVVTLDPSHTRYVVEAEVRGWPQEFAGREVGVTERTWAAWVLGNAQEPHLLDDVSSQRDRMPVLVLDEGAGRTESLLAVPLRVRDETLGALLLMGPRGAFDAGVSRVLGILANQTAAALFALSLVEWSQQNALHDALTGLPNRGALDEALEKTVAQADRQGGTFCVLLLDLDHFKKLNDTHGHLAGDAALKEAARRLRRHLRRADVPARYGGEEFVAILDKSDAPSARGLAERVRKAIEGSPVVFEGTRIPISASIGVAQWPSDGRDPETLLAAADRALYAAKQAGRNRVVAAADLSAS